MNANGNGFDDSAPGFNVYVDGLTCSAEAFKQALVAEGMSAERAEQVAGAIPCYVKKNASREVAVKFGRAFQNAGASIRIESPGGRVAAIELPGAPGKPAAAAQRPAPAPAPAPPAPAPPSPVAFAPPEPATPAPPEPAIPELPELAPPEPELSELAPPEPEPPMPAAAATKPPPASPEVDLPPPKAPADGAEDAEPDKPKDGFPRKEINLDALPDIEEDPWIKRRYPHLIAGAILMIFLSYVYGCTKVMGASGKLRREMSDVNRMLENINAQGRVVTNRDIIIAVQEIGKKCGVSIHPDHVYVVGESLEQERLPGGVCHQGKIPQAFQLLGPSDQQFIMKSMKTCSAPNWIVVIKVETKKRWGLFSREIYATKATWVRNYEP